MSDDQLKTCPFCGAGPAVSIQNASFSGVETLYWHGRYYVNCGTCGAKGAKRQGRAVAISEWNRRAYLPPTPAEAMRCPEVMALVEAMRGAIEAIDAAYDGPDDHGRYSTRERAALSGLEQSARHD